MTSSQTSKQWSIAGQDGFESLQVAEKPVPELGDSEVLVKLKGASLNFRDLAIPKGKYPFPIAPNVVPGSDGAGTVIAVGKNVTRFKTGDDVVTLFNQAHIGGEIDPLILGTGLGGALDGTLREVGAFSEHGLVRMPKGLSYVEAATLTCAGLTAWNALFGLADKKIQPGQWVLTQGTGGVSIFAVQFAKAMGAKVIATTSSADKAELLKTLGADHVINYRETTEWGAEAKKVTGGQGVDHVLEVAGPKTMKQSLEAVRIGGVITIIGFVGGMTKGEDEPGFLQCLNKLCTTRGILVGSRVQMEDMCNAVEANLEKLRPVVDKQVFTLDQVKEAYEYQWSGKHQGKVGIAIA